MSDVFQGSGSCLCGAVTFTATGLGHSVGACHCNMCRKWGGGPYLEVDCGTNVSFDNVANISVYDSSEWAERGFCKHCGSHLFYRIKEGQLHMVPVGLFDNDEGLVFDHQVFIEEKPSYYDFSNKTKNRTGAEIFAEFTSSK
ncbi:GFA family protein [Aurantivibrio infirmus]